MSNLERFENIKQVVAQVEPDFNRLAKIHGAVNFLEEASYALQILKDSDYLAQVAAGNADSLKRAIINVATVGLSLSTVHKLAYLVPRKGKICLDISYRGYVQLAIDVGSIKWVHADIVCERDTFQLRGLGLEPIHTREPFSDRGPIVGAYCVAKTHDGDYITTAMPIDEVYSIRGRSESWRAYERDKSKLNPWLTDESEMIRKTVIRRAYKYWPMTDTRVRFDQAIDVASEVDPIDFTTLPPGASQEAGPDELLVTIRDHLAELRRTEEKYVEHLSSINSRNIKSLEDLTNQEKQKAIVMLSTFVRAQRVREQNAKDKDENAS